MSTQQVLAGTKWLRRFTVLWIGQALSIIGSTLGGFALVWYLTDQTGSATVLATATIFELLPRVVLGPIAGAIVDRFDRRKVMIWADVFVAVMSLGLALLYWRGMLQVWHVYVLMLARATGGTLHWPAMAASTTLLVPEEHLPRVAGFNQMLQGALGVVAPPLGALLMTLLPLHGVMAVDVLTAMLAIATLAGVAIPRVEASQAREGSSLFGVLITDIREGVSHILASRGLTALVILALAVNFFLQPTFSMLPLVVTNVFAKGVFELGWMEATFGLGAVAGGLLLGIWGGFKRPFVTTLSALFVMGGCSAVIGLAPGHLFGLALGTIAVWGFTLPMIDGPINAVMQRTVPPGLQGRVFTVLGSVGKAMSPLSMAIVGPLSDRWGVQWWYVVTGVMCVVFGLASLSMPSLLNLGSAGSGQEAIAEEQVEPAPTTQ